MSKAPTGIVEQAQRLAASARMFPVDDAAKVLEQAVTVLQAAQAQVLVAGERSGELAAASGCRTVRSFAMSILRRSPGDASALASVAVHLVARPSSPPPTRPGGCTPRTCARSSATSPVAGWACCKSMRTRWWNWPPGPGPPSWACSARRC